MEYLIYAQLLILFLAAVPHWYRLIKEVYQDIQRSKQNRRRRRKWLWLMRKRWK